MRAGWGYNPPMPKSFPYILATRTLLCLCLLLLRPHSAPAADPAAGAASPRVTALYTTWDDYYLYVGAQVHDTKVDGVNTTPTSQPQQDDDLEVFLETDNKRADVRTPRTYQMAVSAAGGAYFSVGDGSRVPQARAIYTYKYAVGVDGTLNSNSDTDAGYTIELAIPWQELGLKAAPKAGAVWGFNVLSRDRSSTAAPANRLYSLSEAVKTAADVQTPSRWQRIVFVNGGTADSGDGRIICPHVALDRFPQINGSIVAGEWPSSSRVAFGVQAIDAPAPTVAEEPNTDTSPFDNPPPTTSPSAPPVAQAPTPDTAPPPAPPAPLPGTQVGAIDLPGGGSIKIVPGGLRPPPMVPSVVASLPPDAGIGIGRGRINPLTPKYPKNYKPRAATTVDLTGSLTLGPDKPPRLVMAVYRLDYNADARKAPPQNVWDGHGASTLSDQPMNGAGPWFSALRPQWHRQQMADLRRAGIDIALLLPRGDDPLLGRELDALVEALKEMKAAGQDYPLLGLEAADPDTPAVLSHIPAEFRAPAPDHSGILTAAQTHDLAIDDIRGEGSATILGSALILSPGRLDRNAGATYAAAWQEAIASHAQYVLINSWNDFSRGTEICASRQYGEKYADDTRLYADAFNGDKQWHAKYLAEQCPRTIRPRTLYQVPIRITNAGTLPWRAGEDYSLCPRWYRDGRLYDDSAPRIPVGTDVLPGRSITLSVGLAAQNQYGDDLEPGDYVLVFDMVQGQDRWFSYASDVPLQVPVKVVAYSDALPAQATFIGTQTPSALQSGLSYPTQVTLRNDGSSPWAGCALAYKVQKTDPATGDIRTLSESGGEALPTPIVAGQAVTVNVTARLSALPAGEYQLHWFVRPAKGQEAVAGAYNEAVRVVANDPAASFVLSDIPRTVDAGREGTARLAVQNLGPQAWAKGTRAVGYHWYYLDGTEAQWDGGPVTSLTKEVLAGRADGDITAKFRAPDQPGRYTLAWDVQGQDGAWASLSPASRGNDLLPVIVNVEGRGSVVPVDLRKSLNAVGIASAPLPGGAGGFDGQGRALPAAMLPPDATSEVEGNPILIGRPGPPLYPSGYYAQATGADANSNHRVSFLYAPADAPNIIECRGQTLALPGGSYRAVHLLAAATGGAPITATFSTNSSAALPVTVADWQNAPAGDATLALRSPYRLAPTGAEAVPAALGDYKLPLDPSRRITSLTLPNDPRVKILAISLER